MKKINYKALQNGSDIRGVALPTIADEPVNLTDEAIENIITGFAYLLSNKLHAPLGDLRISVGRDSRLSGKHIAEVVCKTLQKLGVQALDTGLASTPAM
ncbi:MAG: phosphomannomutase/phosphoglucomutase, partial [Prevotellaceae bacterium]|nr:phosphomannomutase/phosphoglucomutase [Prevotellaceae bacterium]